MRPDSSHCYPSSKRVGVSLITTLGSGLRPGRHPKVHKGWNVPRRLAPRRRRTGEMTQSAALTGSSGPCAGRCPAARPGVLTGRPACGPPARPGPAPARRVPSATRRPGAIPCELRLSVRQLPAPRLPPWFRPPGPFVIAGRGYLQHPVGHRDGNAVAGEFADQPECYFGRTFSQARYAAARLRISFRVQAAAPSAAVRPTLLLGAGQFYRLPLSSASAWAIQFRRHDSLIPMSFAIWATSFGALAGRLDSALPELRQMRCRQRRRSSETGAAAH
jgi:hypothetical protein